MKIFLMIFFTLTIVDFLKLIKKENNKSKKDIAVFSILSVIALALGCFTCSHEYKSDFISLLFKFLKIGA